MLFKRLNCRNVITQLYFHTNNGIYGVKPAQEAKILIPKLSGVSRVIVDYVNAYRTYGHKKAQLDPLGLRNLSATELDLSEFDLTKETKLTPNDINGLVEGVQQCDNVGQLEDHLQRIYCGHIAAEFMHLETREERTWFASAFESLDKIELTTDERKTYARHMLESQNFERFLSVKFPTTKRYGAEGAESMMTFLWEIFNRSPQHNIQQIIMSTQHRGRINILSTLLEFPVVVMFQKIEGKLEFLPSVKGLGDVVWLLTQSIDLKTKFGDVHVTIVPNPSNLEANSPVAMGKTRGRMQSLDLGEYSTKSDSREGDGVLCLQMHGDGSLAGQGIIAEMCSLSRVPSFRIGGSVHLVINNQLCFTTEADRSRSSMYCTDVAKMVPYPVVHVNGDHPELAAKAARLALEYRDKFRKDIFVDLVCFRRWGHNELDDPSFTQPVMYDLIESKKSVPHFYANLLKKDGLLTESEQHDWIEKHNKYLSEQLKMVDTFVETPNHLQKQWSGIVEPPSTVEIWDSGVDIQTLKFLGEKSVHTPAEFNVHSHLKKTHCEARVKKLREGGNIDWATAEALAFGSLLYDGFPVRISGQDVGRGTFSQRHVLMVDRITDEGYIPLNHMTEDQKTFLEVVPSILSEEAVLAFEYGMSIEAPKRMVLWEAQYGDFVNGAQIIIDTYVTSGENKWLMQSGLVVLLPHGYDGAGPEHSSCRLERFLQLSDSKECGIDGEDINCDIVNPTTPAQYFHLLRRQMLRNYKKPLIVASPKLLLRLPAASSALDDMAPGTYFKGVIDDPTAQQHTINKVIFCCGKHYYALAQYKEEHKLNNVAIVRIESLCPFPTNLLEDIFQKYQKVETFIWSQEEPRNMGPWFYVNTRFQNNLNCRLLYVGRPELPIAAQAIVEIHEKQQEKLILDSFA